MPRNHHFIVATLALFAASVHAQPAPPAPNIVGSVKNVNGLVTRSDATSATSVSAGSPVAEGQKFVTSSNASIELDLGSGCTVPMGPNQSITINTSLSCTDLRNSITPVVVAGLLSGGAGGLIGPALLGTAALGGQTLIARPATGAASGTNGQGGGIPNPPPSGQ